MPTLNCLGEDVRNCADCGKAMTADDISAAGVNQDGAPICAECAEDQQRCYNCDEIVADGDGQQANGDLYCDRCFDEMFFSCADCGRIVGRDDSSYNRPDGQEICSYCFENNYFVCANCSETFNNDEYARDGLCHECAQGGEDGERAAEETRLFDETTERIGHAISYGIEIETREKIGGVSSPFFNRVEDGSIGGWEYSSVPMRGDKGLDEIKGFCKSLLAAGGGIDKECGMHLHLGCKHMTWPTLGRIARFYSEYEDYFFGLVSKSRAGNRFCMRFKDKKMKGKTESAFRMFCYGGPDRGHSGKYHDSRYWWLNFHSFFYRGTVEIRNHQGTIDPEKICNWIKLHGRIFEFIEKRERLPIIKSWSDFFVFLRKAAGCEMAAYYVERAKKLNGIAVPETLDSEDMVWAVPLGFGNMDMLNELTFAEAV